MKKGLRFLIFITVLTFFLTAYSTTVKTFGESEFFLATISEDGVQRADVIVDSYSFEPNHLVVSVGKPVELRLKSVTSFIPHNFTLNYPETGLAVNQDISHGQDVKVRFTPTMTGSYEFFCDKKFLFDSHKKKGMKGILEVR